MQHHKENLHRKIDAIFKRIRELKNADKRATRTQEFRQLEVYLDQLTRELHHVHEMEHLAREQQRRNFGL